MLRSREPDGGTKLIVFLCGCCEAVRWFGGVFLGVNYNARRGILAEKLQYRLNRPHKRANGQIVELELKPPKASGNLLDLAILVDRSASTIAPIGNRISLHTAPEDIDWSGASVWSAMQSGLTSALSRLRSEDQISLWQFDFTCECLTSAPLGQI